MKEILEIIKKRVESAELSSSEMSMSFIEKQIIVSLIDSALSPVLITTVDVDYNINHWEKGRFSYSNLFMAISLSTCINKAGSIDVSVQNFENAMTKLTKGEPL